MKETVTGTSWGGGPHQKGQEPSWFRQNKYRPLQALANKRALVLGFPSHQPAAGEPLAGVRVQGAWARLLGQGGVSSRGDQVQSPSRCRSAGNSDTGTRKLLALLLWANFFPVGLNLLSSQMGR